MKKLYLALPAILLLFFIACKKDTADGQTSLTGKWKLVANFISMGPPGQWTDVPVKANYDYVQFNANGILAGTVYTDYKTYAIKDSITLVFTKPDQTTIENYRYFIRHDTLVLSPSWPIYCIEGCASRFVKVK